MKKYIFTFFSVSASFFLNAQEQTKLHREFGAQHQENLNKLSVFLNKNTARVSEEASVRTLGKNLASVVNGIPVYWQAEDAKANNASNITLLQNGTVTGMNNQAIDGTGIKILMFDTGKILDTHQEFGAGRIILKETDALATSTHSTSVAGMIGATGVNTSAKGVLPKVTIENYSFSDTSKGTLYQKLESETGAHISNHSYGINLGWFPVTTPTAVYPAAGWYWFGDYELNSQDTYSGSYHDEDANYDKIVYADPNHIVVKSTGNYFGTGPSAADKKFKIDNATKNYVPFTSSDVIPEKNCSKGYNCIGWGALAKNIITVQAVNQLTTAGNLYTKPSDVTKYTYGSAGPRKDGAIKPDFSAVGTIVYVPTSASNTSYNNVGGTSFAAAVVTGAAGALTQLTRTVTGNNSFTFQADQMKALLAHTANEAGNVGPDAWYGWGLIDAKAAAEVIINKQQNNAIFEQKNLTSGTPQTIEITAGAEPLKATISWVDPAAVPFSSSTDLQSNYTSRLINDLDLRIVDTVSGEIYYPWKLNTADPLAAATKGDNTVDNVEQVVVETPVVGRTYKVTVSNKGTLVNDTGAETPSKYTIVVTSNKSNSLSDLTALPSDCEKITAFPTRIKDAVTVLVPMKANQINIYDMSGKKVMNIEKPNSQTLDLSILPKGVYLINVKSQYCNKTRKVIKE